MPNQDAPQDAQPPPSPAAPAAVEAGEGRDAGVVFATRVGMAAAGIASQALLAYLLLPAGRGAYAVCVTFAYLLGMGLSLSGDIGAQFLVMSGRASVSKGLALGICTCAGGSLVGIALALPLILGVGDVAFFAKAPQSAFLASLALIPLSCCSFAAEMQVAGLRRFVALALYLGAQSVVVMVGVVALVWWLGWGVEGGIMALCVGHLVLLGACVWDLRRHAGLRLERPSRRELKGVLDYGLRIHLSRLGSGVEPRIGILALALLGGPREVGMFAAVSAIMLHLHLIADSVSIALYPRVVAAGAGALDMIGRGMRIACAGTALALAVLLPISTPLVALLLSEAFVPAVPMMWIMAPGILAFAAAALFVSYFKGIDRPSVCSWATWAGLSANVVSCVVLYPLLGMAGAAWALTIGLGVRTVCLMVMFHRSTAMSWRALWTPARGDLAVLREALALGPPAAARLDD